jgi:hypothetical protein
MNTVPMTVVETPIFLRKALDLLDEEARSELAIFVATNPEAGDVIPETGGVRKLRWAIRGGGKRGGVRVIYYFHNDSFPLFLLTLFAKNRKANLTRAERNELKKLVPLLVTTYGKGRH